MQQPDFIYELEFLVRDYECDLQGVVNNSVYQNYLEHTRHQYLKTAGLDFAALHEAGTDAMVTRIEIDYKFPLRSGDRFVCRLALRNNGVVRIDFLQNIYRLPDEKLITAAVVTCACMKNGRPVPVKEVFGEN